ncbi:7638_t:CDS:2 [Diversispora eburnea]|uniref:7638_t:CDS:1 n=1 Tax=Diversispora eburnea TaxID=1213867 RepID=A0A9N9BSU6_9GLOM|nr:7638_t:CDS:2 [Diversispora eburnea]
MSKSSVLNTYNFVSTFNLPRTIDSEHYQLIIRQQPKQARLCNSKERGYREDAQNFLQSPYYFMCANLVYPGDDNENITNSSKYLAGTVVSSLHKLKDIDNTDGGFFVFGDISVRIEGRYRLRFSLFEIIREEVIHVQSILSDVFTVYSPKTFPGMSESTFLSRSFSDQGVRIRIRKEHRIQMKRPQSSRHSDIADCEDDIVNNDNNE